MSYHMSGVIFTVVVILAALLTGAALLWSRKMIVQPLAIISSHFDSIAKGIWRVRWRCMAKRNFGDLCQPEGDAGSLRETVSDVRRQLCHAHRDLRDCGWQ